MNNEKLSLNTIYNFIQSLESDDIFWYSVIIIGITIFFSKYQVNLGFILGICIAIFIIIYLHQKKEMESNSYKYLHKDKIDNIIPTPINFEDKEDIIDLVYNIQDFYYENPQVYEEMIDNLNVFFKLYNDTMIATINISQNYEIAKSKMHNAVNCLHSMIHTLNPNKETNSKFNRAHKQLYKALQFYLDKMYDKYEEQLIRNGYDATTKIIENNKPKAHNFYLIDKQYMWDFY